MPPGQMITRRAGLKALCAGLALLASPGLALAHRAQSALTTVTWNARTRALEVVHRLHIHDALQALMEKTAFAAPDLTSVEARARLTLYVADRFALQHDDGAPIPLKALGAELDGDHVYIFQESYPDRIPQTLLIGCSYLQDVFPAQVNQVNAALGGPTRTLTFRTGDGVKALIADAP